jgi:hypothetical protein
MFLDRAAWSIITAVVVWSFSVATAATQEASKNNQIAKEQQKAYAYGRKEMKVEFDRALAKWKELLKEQLKDNASLLKAVTEMLQTIYYNKAAAYANCFGETIANSKSGETKIDISTRFDNCFKEWQEQMSIMNTIIFHYSDLRTSREEACPTPRVSPTELD